MLLTFGRDETATLLREIEREIDAFLIEDLQCSAETRQWLAVLAGIDATDTPDLAVSPIRQPPREDDGRDIALDQPGKPRTVIANRLLPRPRMAEAAREAADMAGERLILLRPEALAARCRDLDGCFDAVLTHDTLADLLRARGDAAGGELGARLLLRAARIEVAKAAAAEAARVVPLNPIADFIEDYLAIVATTFPDLAPRPAMLDLRHDPENPIVVFSPEALPRWPFLPPMRLAHHLREGVVSLCFKGWGTQFPAMVQVMDAALMRTPFQLSCTAQAGDDGPPGLLLLDETAPLSLRRPADAQAHAIAAAIADADRLRRWFTGQRGAARYWAEVAGAGRPGTGPSRVRRDLALH